MTTTVPGTKLYRVSGYLISAGRQSPGHRNFPTGRRNVYVAGTTINTSAVLSNASCGGAIELKAVNGEKATNNAVPAIVVAKPKGRVIKISIGTNQGL